MTPILCPLCRLVLDPQTSTWRCAQGHAFDVAREGYVNLLLVQNKSSPEPGDSAEMVQARREFLGADHYRPLRDAVLALLAPLRPRSVLDTGCGEGYYTGAFTALTPDVIGVDIAKPAIRLAAKRYRDITWLVASGAALPLADGAMDVVCNMFTQIHLAEMLRVLAPRGHVLVVTPAADHLQSLRAELFDEVRAHEPEKFMAEFESAFEALPTQEVRVPLTLTQQALRQLLAMTPYVWKAKPGKRAALESRESFATEAAFTLLLFRKRVERS